VGSCESVNFHFVVNFRFRQHPVCLPSDPDFVTSSSLNSVVSGFIKSINCQFFGVRSAENTIIFSNRMLSFEEHHL